MRNDMPVSEQYRLAAREWVEMDAAARMLEEGKTTYLAQQKAALGDIPDSKAEKLVKASPQWADYIKKMVNTKTVANRQRVELDYLKMRHMERTSEEANARSERKL
ncbi:MAG: hypothetical protein ACRCYS_14180 [Beijerinckiaceae bacterium]